MLPRCLLFPAVQVQLTPNPHLVPPHSPVPSASHPAHLTLAVVLSHLPSGIKGGNSVWDAALGSQELISMGLVVNCLTSLSCKGLNGRMEPSTSQGCFAHALASVRPGKQASLCI